jgi:hypothetical protein
VRGAVLLAIVASCAPRAGSAFIAHYDVEPRALLPAALDATRDMYYQVAALDSKDARHASFLALDGIRERAQTALLVTIERPERPRCRRCGTSSDVRLAVTPLAFRDGHELPATEVPAATRADADQLMLTIYDRARSDRHFH